MIVYLDTIGCSLTVSSLVTTSFACSSCPDSSGYFLEFDLISFNSIISYNRESNNIKFLVNLNLRQFNYITYKKKRY